MRQANKAEGGNVPIIGEMISLNEALNLLKNEGNIELTAFHTEGEVSIPMSDIEKSIAIFIGPEGGWSPNEISLFHRNDIRLECLGQQVLRTETAVISALSLIILDK